VTAPAAAASDRPRWVAFTAVTAAYLAVTVAESILAPVLPTVADELGLDLGAAGSALGTLTGAIAVGNLGGGWLLARAGGRVTIVGGLVVTAAGCAVVATAADLAGFLGGQALIGLGAGAYFPAGLQAAGWHAGASRRGLAMGLFGVAFSVGLTAAALLAALGARLDWRFAFVAAAVLCVVSAATLVRTPLPARRPRAAAAASPAARQHVLERRASLARLRTPVVAGGIASVCQYGTVGFLPTYAVTGWGMSAAGAALLLAAARVVSVPAKLLAGAASDRFGPRRTLAVVGALLVTTGLVWTLLPASVVVFAAAVVFGGTVSAVFPVANVVALAQFGDRGGMLGTFRSVQVAVGAAGAWAVGAASGPFGLAPVLAVTTALPAGLVWLARQRHPGDAR
jgi:predicted MFS family arabinose efflux permease